MRTFHTGGIAGQDITTGLPRVEELFEARVPKGQAIISEIDGVVSTYYEGDARHIRVVSSQNYSDVTEVPPGAEVFVSDGDAVDINTALARAGDHEFTAALAGLVRVEDGQIVVEFQEEDSREYVVPPLAQIRVDNAQTVTAGQALTDGPRNPQDVLRIQGREAAQIYLVEEVQSVYRSQGVTINDKHIEIIARQMLRRVSVDTPGDTEILPGELIDAFEYEEINAKVLAEGGEPATAQSVLLGVTKASLNNNSFLAAASFQETTRVLTEAAVQGKVDRLVGLKENVIIGKLIPAGSGVAKRREIAARKDAFLAIATDALIGTPSDDAPSAEEISFPSDSSDNGDEGESVSQTVAVEPAGGLADPPEDGPATTEGESQPAQLGEPSSHSADAEPSEDIDAPTAVEDEAPAASHAQTDDAPAQPVAEPPSDDAASESSTEPEAGSVS
jgi:DNA-directed RNA polymerase subunit beta'